MSAEIDLSQYLDLFLQEAQEQLEILESETLKLETEPTQERMQTIFRAAHTLKGSSRAMGFSSLAEVTHEVENVLDALRNDQLKINTQIADALLAGIDAQRQIVELIASGESAEIDCSLLVRNLQAVLNDQSVVPAPANLQDKQDVPPLPAEIADALEEAHAQTPVFRARIQLDSECVLKFARAFMSINQIEESGEVLALSPTQEQLEAEQFENVFDVYFQSQTEPAGLAETVRKVSEVISCEIQAWDQLKEIRASATSIPTTIIEDPAVPVEREAAPAGNASQAASSSGSGKASSVNQTVRVDVTRLDMLMNLVGELVIDRTRIAQIGQELSSKYQDDHVESLSETVSHIARITGDLQDLIMKTRMMPIETVFNRFPRVVRDLAQKLGKDVKLELAGGETELDRSVLEVIGDPLLHILRNSVDHGLEGPADREAAGKPAQGTVRLSARHSENHIVIEIADDGRGIDTEKIREKAVRHGLVTPEASERLSEKEVLQFIFASGFSTAAEVSEVSGRGVGMDIVRSNLQKLGGLVDLETKLGEGTRFQLRLPLTLAIIRGLLVSVDRNVYVLPLTSVIETLWVPRKDIQRVNHREVIVIRGLTTPLVRMGTVFPLSRQSDEKVPDEVYIVVVGVAEKRVGLIVDRLIGEQEVVIKSLSRFCGEVSGVSGATILGDGNVALIVDVNGIIPSERVGK